jgi:hypothetical protein
MRSKAHISVRRTLLLVVIVALAAAAGAGAVYATHTFTNADGNILACVNHYRGVISVIVDAAEPCTPDRVTVELALRGGRVANADNADNAANAANADLLDGIDSTGFYLAGSKVADSDLLDGIDSTAFMGDTLTRRENATTSTGTAFAGGHFRDRSCDSGEALLSGGPANIDAGTVLLESFPITTNTWRVRIQNDSSLDAFSVVVLCASR